MVRRELVDTNGSGPILSETVKRPPAFRNAAVDGSESSVVGAAIQFSGTVLVTMLCGILRRTVHRRFLDYWAAGWCCMAIALMGLLAGLLLDSAHTIGYGTYCF